MHKKEFLKTKFKNIRTKIESYSSIVVLGHERTDGDALGSSQALGRAIAEEFPEKKVFTPLKSIPDNLTFLPIRKNNLKEINWKKSLLILVDCDTITRTDFKNQKPKELLIIDHHQSNVKINNFSWIDSQKSSAAEMVTEFLLNENWLRKKEIALLLYVGIVTDNGNFTFGRVTAKTFQLMAKLFEWNFDYEAAQKKIEAKTKRENEILIYILQKAVWEKNWVFFTYLPENQKELAIDNQQLFKKHVNYYRHFKEVEIWAFITQIKKEDVIRVNLRSKGKYDVAKICRFFGGNGHKNAAGCQLKNYEEIVKLKEKIVAEYGQNR